MLLFNYSLFEIGFKMRKKLVGPLVQYEPPKKLEKKSSRGKIFNFFGDSNFFPLKLFFPDPDKLWKIPFFKNILFLTPETGHGTPI